MAPPQVAFPVDTIDFLRDLRQHNDRINAAGDAVLRSAAWIVALLLVFVPLSVRAYQLR